MRLAYCVICIELIDIKLPKIAEVSDETSSEELHELIHGSSLTGQLRTGCGQTGHQVIRIDLMCVEDCEFATRLLHHLLPYFLPILQLQKSSH